MFQALVVLTFLLCRVLARQQDISFANESSLGDSLGNDLSEHFNILEERWYGLDEHDPENPQSPFNFAWPITCTNPVIQPVRYCYRNARSAVNLKDVVVAAIVRWSVATEHTSLKIIPDPRCIDQSMCLCGDLPTDARDALVISDRTKKTTGPDSSNPTVVEAEKAHNKLCATHATTGYEYIPPAEPDRPFRHKMNVCALDPYDRDATFEMAVAFIMHEFGHVFGLRHEHQRSDRAEFLQFRCHNLKGYDEASAVIMSDPMKLFVAPHLRRLVQKERMKLVCSQYPYANYIDAMTDFIMEDRRKKEIGEDKVNSFKWSNEFDYDSIMIYSDRQGSVGGKDVIRRRNPKTNLVIEGRIYQGGMSSSRDWKNSKPSEGDAARIAQLYDAHTPECEAQKKGTKDWATKGYKAKAEGSKEVYVPPPTRSRARAEREALELLKRSEL